VDVDRPYDLVHYLKLLVPRKRIAELYISIGFNKQGKTELYRDLMHHIEETDDRFQVAPGERGMVMSVFTMSTYPVVFKIIRDRFAHPKATSRQRVMGKYQLVYRHDRAGRLVDAQEFEHLRFRRDRFQPALLADLLSQAGQTVSLEGDFVVISHAYVERRVVPLNLYAAQAEDGAARAAVIDYGNSIKDLIAVDIFPGDLLLKNFGVTPNGRVVFYDYDEVCLLRDCRFRSLPSAQSYDEELSDTIWRAVRENDVFPEEFGHFLGLSGSLREVFLAHHADLFDVAYWRRVQERILSGELMHIYPYDQSRRLAHLPATAA
jgi:isocitrate dehydrogenase kinase/phosphatase